jgi:hypothetical protein
VNGGKPLPKAKPPKDKDIHVPEVHFQDDLEEPLVPNGKPADLAHQLATTTKGSTGHFGAPKKGGFTVKGKPKAPAKQPDVQQPLLDDNPKSDAGRRQRHHHHRVAWY